MGSAVQPANELHLEIVFGDRSGEVAGLALWQDDKLVRQLDSPPVGGRWEVAVPALPGSFLYAVATELDGDLQSPLPRSGWSMPRWALCSTRRCPPRTAM